MRRLREAGCEPYRRASLDALVHQGMVSQVGTKAVSASKRVKICNGTQDGTLTTMRLPDATEEIVLAISDRPYLAEYVRSTKLPESPTAVHALLSMCVPPAAVK